MKYAIHPDFKSISRIPAFRTRLGISFVRHRYKGLFEYEHDIPGVKVCRLNIPAESSPTGFVRSVLYTPEVLKSKTMVLFCHGGALVFPALPYHYRFARTTASELGCIVLMPGYHLAPEYRMTGTGVHKGVHKKSAVGQKNIHNKINLFRTFDGAPVIWYHETTK